MTGEAAGIAAAAAAEEGGGVLFAATEGVAGVAGTGSFENAENEKSKRYSGPSSLNRTFAVICAGTVLVSTVAFSERPSFASASGNAASSLLVRVAASKLSLVTMRPFTSRAWSIGSGCV